MPTSGSAGGTPTEDDMPRRLPNRFRKYQTRQEITAETVATLPATPLYHSWQPTGDLTQSRSVTGEFDCDTDTGRSDTSNRSPEDLSSPFMGSRGATNAEPSSK